MRARFISASLIVAHLAVVAPSFAQSASDRALAQSLFDEGKKLMNEGKYAEACPKLAESQRLDPGGGTLLNLAVCHEKEGKIASAWTEFNESISQAKKDNRPEREAFSRERVAALEPKLSRVSFNVAPETAAIDGVQIKIAGATFGKAAFGIAMPVDPGKHEIEVTAPGKKPWKGEVEIGAEADKKTVDVPALEDAPAPPPAPATTTTTTSITTDTAPASNKKTIGFIVGGAGVVALGVGAVFGLRAFSKWGERDDNCPNNVCNQEAVRAADSARTSANIANVGVGLGLIGIGVGTFLILTAPKSEQAAKTASAKKGVRVTPEAGPGGVFLGVSGTF